MNNVWPILSDVPVADVDQVGRLRALMCVSSSQNVVDKAFGKLDNHVLLLQLTKMQELCRQDQFLVPFGFDSVQAEKWLAKPCACQISPTLKLSPEKRT